ncbi:DUF2846 domain-containing protein [Sphingomonas jaspsi]|uniref:DUF2846 domain-containing protein n=1 Tax=Sphingomonas jaspsi TaxID=392409 RepID=UPI0004B8E8A1|nr:DUF2846 domain-containing protein [Sphingomonas jaspsi]
MKKSMLMFAAAAVVLAAPSAAVAGGAKAPATIPAPKPGMGQVVFFRPGGMGGAVKCTVREDGKMVGRVSGNRYWVIDAAPGTHTYTAKSEATDTVNVQVEPDETTFVKCKISMGIMVGRPNLSPSTQEEWDKAAAKLEPMEAAKLAEEMAKDQAELAAKAAAK